MKNSQKGVYINLLLIYYQKVIKSISIGYQNEEFTTEKISICNQNTNNLLLKQKIELETKNVLPKIKSKAFIRLLPQIFALREQGYSYEEVTAILEKQHGLILSVKQFSVYLARYKNAHTSKVEKQIETSPAPKHLQESKQESIKSESNTNDYAFGSPQHKAIIQKETEELFRSNQNIGLRQIK